MKASELAEKLAETGTGKAKLDTALSMVSGKKNPQGLDLLRALNELGHSVTVKKGADILGLKELPDFSTPLETKKMATRLAEAERERDQLREQLAKLEVQTLGPKAV